MTGIIGLFLVALVGWIVEKNLRLALNLDLEMRMHCMKD